MNITELKESSIKFSQEELTQRDVDRLLRYLFDNVDKIPSVELLEELLNDAETLTETVKQFRALL